jgi:Uma2 family endonuclease
MATIPELTTAEEFETICQEIGPCELVRGEVIKLSPGGLSHSEFSVNVAYLLKQWAKASGRGRVIGCEAGIIVEVGPDTVRGADAAFISFEILGKGQGWRDMVEKAGEYLRMGVDRVWVIDPDSESVHVFQSDAEPSRLNASDELADATVLPGFACKVADIFSD